MNGLGYEVTKEEKSFELATQVRKTLDKLVEEKKIEKKIIRETIGQEPFYKIVQSTPHVGWNERPRNAVEVGIFSNCSSF